MFYTVKTASSTKPCKRSSNIVIITVAVLVVWVLKEALSLLGFDFMTRASYF